MIVDLFPKAGGTPVTIKSRPYVHNFMVPVPRYSTDKTEGDRLRVNADVEQPMAIGRNASLYLLGADTYGGYGDDVEHFVRVTWDPLVGYSKAWSINNATPKFKRVVTDSLGFAYVTRSDGMLEKYNEDGDILWTIAESGVLCVGGNGNLFAWTASYIKEYDLDGNLINTWDYVCAGTPKTFYVNADRDFFIVTTNQLARITSSLEVLWTYAYGFNALHAVDIDESGNVYVLGDADGLNVKCISSDGVEKWNSSNLSYSDIDICIRADNLGGVYAIAYNSMLYKLDARTGLVVWSQDVAEYMGNKMLLADKCGNIYVWSDSSVYGLHHYIGTVNWNENGNTQEQFATYEAERGDNYILFLNDNHNEGAVGTWLC